MRKTTRLSLFTTLILSTLLLSLSQCLFDSDSDSSSATTSTSTSSTASGLNVEFTKGAIQATPSISGNLISARISIDEFSEFDNTNSLHTEAQSALESFFKRECHMPDQTNYCANNVEQTMDNKFSITTLIGLIYHAQMYNGVYSGSSMGFQNCNFNANDVELTNHVLYNTTEGVKATSHSYLANFNGVYDCVGSGSYSTSTFYTAYSKGEDLKTFPSLTIRKQERSTEFSEFDMNGDPYASSDVLETMALFHSNVNANSNAEITPDIMAFSGASFNSMNMRTHLLLNVPENKYIVRYQSSNPSQGILNREIISMGTAGFNFTTQEYNTGYFAAKYIQNSNTEGEQSLTFCLQNGTAVQFVNSNYCTENENINNYFEAAQNTDEVWATAVKPFIGVTDTDELKLGGFANSFQNSALGDPSNVPANHNNFMDSLSNE